MDTNKPIEKFSDGDAKAAIFKSRNGDWLEVNLRRVYQAGGEWKNSSTYGLYAAKRAHNVLGQAIAFMEAQDQQPADISELEAASFDQMVEAEDQAIAAE